MFPFLLPVNLIKELIKVALRKLSAFERETQWAIHFGIIGLAQAIRRRSVKLEGFNPSRLDEEPHTQETYTPERIRRS
jgi:hypothetical protein